MAKLAEASVSHLTSPDMVHDDMPIVSRETTTRRLKPTHTVSHGHSAAITRHCSLANWPQWWWKEAPKHLKLRWLTEQIYSVLTFLLLYDSIVLCVHDMARNRTLLCAVRCMVVYRPMPHCEGHSQCYHSISLSIPNTTKYHNYRLISDIWYRCQCHLFLVTISVSFYYKLGKS